MAASKAKTTMQKLNRERKMREKRLDKEARKIARQNAPAEAHNEPHDLLLADVEAEPDPSGVGR